MALPYPVPSKLRFSLHFHSLPPTNKFPLPSFFLHCSKSSVPENSDNGEKAGQSEVPKKRLSEQSSWEAKDSEGKDYLYRLGKEADNMNIAVGARAGVIDDLFAGKFLGRDCKFFPFGFLMPCLVLMKLHDNKERNREMGLDF